VALDSDSANERLARWTEWQARLRSREMGAIAEGSEQPMLFVAGEVLVGRDDRDLVEECLAKGGAVIEPTPLIEAPPDVRRTRDFNPVDFPMPVRIRFNQPVREETPERTLRELQERHSDGAQSGTISVSDVRSASIASFVGRKSALGRSIILNVVGQPSTLPLLAPLEGTGASEGPDPSAWASFQPPVRVVEAWQLLESARVAKSLQSVVWIAILDNGFWVDVNGAPLPGAGETASDFGPGVAGFNIIAPGTSVGGGNTVPNSVGTITPWHGNSCASVAAATVGNGLGAAGTGGTVARPFLFKMDYSMDHTIKCLRYITAWGLDVASMSFSSKITPFLWWDSVPNGYDEAFKFAHDNGVIIIVAAGNDSSNLPDYNVRPATRTPGVLTVGALAADLQQARSDSNYGSSVGIWAPGASIPVAPDQKAGVTFNATSAATPFVAGVAAMMRAVDPAINPAKVSETLIRRGWAGPPGSKVTKGIDAYATVLDVLGDTLPADLGEPNQTPQTAAQLYDTGGGVLTPLLGGRATHAPGNADFWKFDLTEVSDVTISLVWYQRLGNLTLSLQAMPPDNDSIDDTTTTATLPGSISMAGTLGPANYVLRVAGSGLTAYELSVRPKLAVIKADIFEPNDSFDSATRLLFDPPSPFSIFPSWGPGNYDATLHQRLIPGIGFLAVNEDYFALHVPPETNNRISQVSVYKADHPLDVSLYDSSQQLIQSWQNQKLVAIKPPAGTVSYLKVSGSKATRYKIGIGRWVDPAVLPPAVEQAKVFPEWWKNPKLDVDSSINHFAIDVRAERDNGKIVFAPTQEDFGLELLDMSGAVARQGVRDEIGRTTIATEGLTPGPYLMKVRRAADVGTASLSLQLVAPIDFG